MNPTITVYSDSNKKTAELTKRHLFLEASKLPFNDVRCLLVDDCESLSEVQKRRVHTMGNLIQTDFVLVVENDSTILTPTAWSNVFFEYDYIGAPWLNFNMLLAWDGTTDKDLLVGNGGFSIRSKKLCRILSDGVAGEIRDGEPEDAFICQRARKQLVEAGVRFAPYNIAMMFSVENAPYVGQFGAHHGFFDVFGRYINLKGNKWKV